MLLEISGEITRKNEGMEPKQKQRPAVSGTDEGSSVACCKELSPRSLECQARESRHVGSGQGGDGESERRHPRNQLTVCL